MVILKKSWHKSENQIIIAVMSATHISVTEASRNFADIINRARFKREEFILEKGGVPVATITPHPASLTAGELALILPTFPRMGIEEAELYARDVRAIRKKQTLPDNPWGKDIEA